MVKNGHIGFARDGARQQRLAGARRADQQHALGDMAAELLEFLRVAQEVDDLVQVFLGLVDAGDVLERHAALALGQHLGAALAEAHGLAAARLHLADEEDPDAAISSIGNQLMKTLSSVGMSPSVGLHLDLDIVVEQALHQPGIVLRRGRS